MIEITTRVELPERGIADRIIEAVIYGAEGNKFGGRALKDNDDAF